MCSARCSAMSTSFSRVSVPPPSLVTRHTTPFHVFLVSSHRALCQTYPLSTPSSNSSRGRPAPSAEEKAILSTDC
ncbi:hypothetical protein BV25DRAFT_1833712 [Artomyces pyxidatus]|uniref:Uncharacterized protein n=1 Tax=Artomyces pyxidatus TaxID=48021 RepID=A0ACB8SDH0_9AGAM|nr:hypothetical protein BV25DRAFT_1833712 [Artomyces pyxidatus]